MNFKQTGYLLSSAITLATLSFGAYSPVAGASATDAVAKMVSEGSANLSLRYRFESVEQDNALDDAEASTLKSRLTLKSATVNGFTALLEADDVMTIGSDDYNSTMVDDEHFGTHSVVADPVGTEINQAWLKYAFSDKASATGGRQRINHAGQRFVGGVGWRQNEQTYDAATVSYTGDAISVDYSYVWRVNRIFDGSGTSVQATEFDSDSHFLYANIPAGPGTLGAFVYALDFEEAAALSSVTYGVSYDASFDRLSLAASAATQSDYADNNKSYDALYLALEAGFAIKPVTLIGGYELLGSDDGDAAFTTPLATLHKFQGWADIFLATPAAGVEDIYVGAKGKLGPVVLGAFYHDFSADEGSADYGSEVDLVATYPLNKQISLQVKYADYNADELAVDTRKLWLSVMANF